VDLKNGQTVRSSSRTSKSIFYQVECKKGQRLTAEVREWRLGSCSNPYVSNRGHEPGFEVAASTTTALCRPTPLRLLRHPPRRPSTYRGALKRLRLQRDLLLTYASSRHFPVRWRSTRRRRGGGQDIPSTPWRTYGRDRFATRSTCRTERKSSERDRRFRRAGGLSAPSPRTFPNRPLPNV